MPRWRLVESARSRWLDWRSDSTVCCAASLNWASACVICSAPVACACMPSLTASTARRQRLHLLDDLRQLAADLLDLLHAAADLLGEFVHAHHARGDRRLHLLDHLLDVVGGDRGLVGEAADLGGDDREAAAVLAGLFGFDGGIERQQVGLVGHLGDRGDDLVDVAGLFVEHRQLGVDRAGGLHDVAHGLFHARQPGLAVARQRRRVLGDRRDLVHRPDQLLGGGGDLPRGRADLHRRRRDLAAVACSCLAVAAISLTDGFPPNSKGNLENR